MESRRITQVRCVVVSQGEILGSTPGEMPYSVLPESENPKRLQDMTIYTFARQV